MSLSKKEINYREILQPYVKKWIWFALALFIAIVMAFLKIRYSTPLYEVSAKLQIVQDQNAGSELGAFRDLGLLNSSNSDIEDEIEILNSRANFIQVVKKLGINISIYAIGEVHETELYDSPPFKINFLIPDSLVYNSKAQFYITIKSKTSFDFYETMESAPLTLSFGNQVNSSIGDFILTPGNSDMSLYTGNNYRIAIRPVKDVAISYQKKVDISLTKQYLSIVSISLEDAVIEKAENIINTLISVYNQNYIDDRKEIADKTSEFINARITDIYGNLSNVDQTAEEFKSGRGITDVASQSNINLNIIADYERKLETANIQLNMASSMSNLVENQEGYEILPSNIGLSNSSIANTTARYNELILERDRLLKSSNEKNPIIVNLDQQLEGLKRNMQSSLASITNNLNLEANNLSSQLSRISARIYAAPGNERALRDITRQQQTKEALYLYLLQKREESQISFASTTPKSKIIDGANETSKWPVSPKKQMIFLSHMLLALLLPIMVIYLNQLLDNKIHNKVGLEKIVGSIPVLAEIPKLSKKENTLVQTGERSILAESLRILRTNIDYIIKSRKVKGSRGNRIFVTSSVPGEGKTLVSANLAMIFAKANKKVLLIGADIRNPRIYQFYSGKNVDRLGKSNKDQINLGLTDYLADKTFEISDIISPMLAHEQMVDVIYSGKIPPNPAELLMSERMKDLLKLVSSDYDYVIVDTAPLMVVTDTLLISEFADQILYVTRAEVTELKVLEFPLKLHKEGKLKGLAFIVNGVKSSNLGYGGKYGYGYGNTTKKWWRFGV